MVIDLKFNKNLTEEEQKQVKDEIESRLKDGEKLGEFAKEAFNIAESTLRIELKKYGMTINTRKSKVEVEKKSDIEVDVDYKFLQTLPQDRQHSFRTSQSLVDEFTQEMAETFPNVSVAKLISLSMQEFLDKVREEKKKKSES